jgi:IS5 family transposase
MVYADKIYDRQNNQAGLAARGIRNGILKKGAQPIKLPGEDRRRHMVKSRRRPQIERILAHFKKWQHYRRVRYVGLIKNQLELTLKAVTYNLRRLVTLATV